MTTIAKANDKYRSRLRATFIDGVDTTLSVDAIPQNVPTIITVGWDTDYETVFLIEATSGDNSSNYALTSITKLRGYTGNLPEDLAVNCLNHEEYFNQWAGLLEGLTRDGSDLDVGNVQVKNVANPTDAQDVVTKVYLETARVVTTTDDATAVIDVTVTDDYELSAIANATTFSTTGTPTNGQKFVLRFKDAGVAKDLTWDPIFVAIGCTLPTTTVAGKWHYVGGKYNTAASKIHILAVAQEE